MKISLAAALLLTLAAALLLTLAAGASAQTAEKPAVFPALAPPTAEEKANLGIGIQRTMTLLATSTPTRRNKVRILFYGQSITEQEWSKKVSDDLRRRFPNADLEIENRAIGGFASQRLIRPAEHDLYPFYPDLLIFHVYGGNGEYEEIIRSVRTRTTAEVLMQKDHVAAGGVQTVPDEKADKGLWWDWMMNNRFLPDIAKKYGCALADIRTPWLDYLKTNKLEPKALLKDGVHLNDWGNFVMAELVERNFVYRPDLPTAPWRDLVKTVSIGKDAAWKNNRLVVPFDGNRVDIVATRAGSPLQIRIDGKKPSELPGPFRITRPTPGPWSPLALTRVDHDTPLIAEKWTLTITAVGANSETWKYDIVGSVTGPDGSGSSDAPFVSKSGRVRIDPAAFFRNGTIPPGYAIRWQAVPLFTDTVTPAAPGSAVTVVQGIPNTTHTLEILAESGPPSIDAIRIYRPPVR